MKILLLSYPINDKTPIYGKNPKPLITQHTSIMRGDSASGFIIKLHNHTGTHVDAPRHFIPDGKAIWEYSPEELVFDNPLLLECLESPGGWVEVEDLEEANLEGIDCLFVHTGFGTCRGSEKYRTNNPGISPEAILHLRERFPKIRCLGIDSISISGYQDKKRGRRAHLAAFGRQKGLDEPLLLIEDMNLHAISQRDKLMRIILLPWQIFGIDSAPCTVIAEVAEKYLD